jgi:hypothetical protein
MSSIRQTVYNILIADSPVLAEVSTRIYMPFAPSATALPFIVFRSDMTYDSFTKDNSSKTDAHSVEIDIYHNTMAEADALGKKVYTALQGYTGTASSGNIVDGCRLTEESEDYDEDLYPIWTQNYEIRLIR